MTVVTIKPREFTQEELNGADKIRKRIGNKLPKLFDDDFYLARWYRSHDGNLDRIEHYLRIALNNRQSIGLDIEDLMNEAINLPLIADAFPHFSVSIPSGRIASGDVCVFVHRMLNSDLKQILRSMPTSKVQSAYFCLQEMYSRAILERERQTGRPSAMVVIFDLYGLNLTDYLNPLGVCIRFTRFITQIWTDMFGENVVKLLIVHPPGILSVMWQIVKWLLDEKTESKLEIIYQTNQLLDYLDSSVVPASYGGQWIDTSGFADPPESCCSRPRIITAQDYYKPGAIWQRNGFSGSNDNRVRRVQLSVPAKHTQTVPGMVREGSGEGGRLVWQFTTNGDVQFDVILLDEQGVETTAFPQFTVNSMKVCEEGEIDCPSAGQYLLRFRNNSGSWFNLKIDCYVAQC